MKRCLPNKTLAHAPRTSLWGLAQALAVAAALVPRPALCGPAMTLETAGSASKITAAYDSGTSNSIATDTNFGADLGLAYVLGDVRKWEVFGKAGYQYRTYESPRNTTFTTHGPAVWSWAAGLNQYSARVGLSLYYASGKASVYDARDSANYQVNLVSATAMGVGLSYALVQERSRAFRLLLGGASVSPGGASSGGISLNGGTRVELGSMVELEATGKQANQTEGIFKIGFKTVFGIEQLFTSKGRQSTTELKLGITIYLPFQRHKRPGSSGGGGDE